MFETAFNSIFHHVFFRVILTSLIVVVVFVLYIRFLEKNTLFLPIAEIVATPKEMDLPYEDIYFSTIDKVRLNGWLVKSSKSSNTVLFIHGNAGNIGDRLAKIAMFHEMGLNVFIFDYRGFGKSEGKPSEQGIYYDALAAYDYLVSREDVNNKRIIIYGVSMGGTAAVEVAWRRKAQPLILDSTFSSAADMAKRIFPLAPSFLLSVKLDNIGKIPHVLGPKLFIHSQGDEVIPFALGKKLFDAAPGPKHFLEIEGDHNGAFLESPQEFKAGIIAFLEKYHYF